MDYTKLILQFEDLCNKAKQQQDLLVNMAQVINVQSQALVEMNGKLNSIIYKLADMEIKDTIIDDNIRDLVNGMENLSVEIQDTKNSISNIKVYRSIMD